MDKHSNDSEDALASEGDMDKEHDVADEHGEKAADEEQSRNHLHRIATDVPPNGGYGWVCVACCFLINAHTWGVNSSYSVFLAYYLSSSTFPGSSRLAFAFIGGLSFGMAVLLSPLATFCVHKLGTNVTLFIGVLFETASFIGASFTTDTWQLFLSQGLCFGIGMGFLFVASVAVPPQWFTTRRSLANAVAAAGSGLGGLIYSLGASAMIQSIGLPWAFRTLGIVCFVVNTACAVVIRDRNKQIRPSMASFDHKYLANIDFLLLSSWTVLSILGYVVLVFSLANYASSIGLDSSQGSVVAALFNLGQMLGRPPIGYFRDAMGRLNMAALMTFLSGLFAFVIWIFSKSYGVLIFYAIIGGTVAGTFWATVAPVAAEVHGMKQLPAVLSLTWLAVALPAIFSEPIALEIVNLNNGSYLGAQIFVGFMYIGAAGAIWVLRARTLGHIEQAAIAEGRRSAAATAVTEGIQPDNRSDTQVGVGNQEKVSPFVRRMLILKRV